VGYFFVLPPFGAGVASDAVAVGTAAGGVLPAGAEEATTFAVPALA
jgi:hypothetical protein